MMESMDGSFGGRMVQNWELRWSVTSTMERIVACHGGLLLIGMASTPLSTMDTSTSQPMTEKVERSFGGRMGLSPVQS